MTKIRNLSDAKKIFLRRKYSDVVRLLEPEVFRFRESFLYYRLLGLSCLYLQDGGGAHSYLRRALQIKDDDATTLLGVAALHLKKRNLDEALSVWLRVLEIDPANRTARRGLNRVRKGMSADAVSRLVDSGRIRIFFPPQPLAFSPVWLVGILVGLGLAAGIYGVTVNREAILASLNPSRPAVSQPTPRPEIAAVELSGNALRTDAQAKARFMFTEAEVDAVWKKAKDLFLAYRDNAAVYELNRLLLSNASPYIKESARRLKAHALTPGFKDFVNFRDNYAFSAVRTDPLLYDGCFVLWRGTIANLLIGTRDIRFQLLVGSHDNRSFEGSVPVIFDFADKFENNYYIELLGKVAPAGDRFRLQGVLFRRLIPDHPVDAPSGER
jgi:tetratricopeptide (TPR) repeat protein